MGDVEQYSMKGHRAGKADCTCIMCASNRSIASQTSRRIYNEDDARRARNSKWLRRAGVLFTILVALFLIFVMYPK